MMSTSLWFPMCTSCDVLMMQHIVDIDGDGVVGVADLKIAKQFDLDGSGILEEAEQRAGKETMAQAFCRYYQDRTTPRGSFVRANPFPGTRQSLKSHNFQETVDRLAATDNFAKTMSRLHNHRFHEEAIKGCGMKQCLTDASSSTRKSGASFGDSLSRVTQSNRWASSYARWGGQEQNPRNASKTQSHRVLSRKMRYHKDPDNDDRVGVVPGTWEPSCSLGRTFSVSTMPKKLRRVEMLAEKERELQAQQQQQQQQPQQQQQQQQQQQHQHQQQLQRVHNGSSVFGDVEAKGEADEGKKATGFMPGFTLSSSSHLERLNRAQSYRADGPKRQKRLHAQRYGKRQQLTLKNFGGGLERVGPGSGGANGMGRRPEPRMRDVRLW